MPRAAPFLPGWTSFAWSLAALCVAGPAFPRDKPGFAVPPFPVGCDPAAVHARLADVDSAQISHACGNMNQPWAYRGPSGRHMAMQIYGRRSGDRAWARGFAAHLLAAGPVDSVYKVPSTQVACDSSDAAPLYFVMLRGQEWQTFVLLRFDVGAALLFDGEQPLGMIRLAGRADSLWAALADRLDEDPLLRGPRPAPFPQERHYSDSVYVEEFPSVLDRVAPHYPDGARMANVEGTVLVEALVGKDGAVHDAIIVTGPAELRDEALAAVWRWKFEPAMANHDPVAVWVCVPVRFRLR